MSYEENRKIYVKCLENNYKKIDECLDEVFQYYRNRKSNKLNVDIEFGQKYFTNRMIEQYEGELKRCLDNICDCEKGIEVIDKKVLEELE